MNAQDLGRRFAEQASALVSEVKALADLFGRTSFMNDGGNMAHAHFGYLMAALGQVDAMAACHAGDMATWRQTPRMISFLDQYVHPGQADVHRGVVQMARHTLMHTGALRYIFDRTNAVGLTWRVHFGELPAGVQHYTLTPVDPPYQNDLLSCAQAAGYVPTSTAALNLSLTAFALDIARASALYVTDLLKSPALAANAQATYPKIQIQALG